MRIINLIRQYFLENFRINYFRKVFHIGWLSSRLFFMECPLLIIRPFVYVLIKRRCTWRRIFLLNLITLRINHKLRFNGLLRPPYLLLKLLVLFMSMIIILLLLLLLRELRMNKFLNPQLIALNNAHITQGWLIIRIMCLLLLFHQVYVHLFSSMLTYVYNLVIRYAFWIWWNF